MQLCLTIVPLLLSVVLAMYIIPRILLVSVKKDLVIPSETHDKDRQKVPRLGGISLFPVLVISVGTSVVLSLALNPDFLLGSEPESAIVQYLFALAGVATVYLLGVMDDLIGVSLTSKLAIEFIASLLIPLSGLWLNDFHGLLGIGEVPAAVGMPVTVFTILYITNAIPILDDVDGLASGLAMIAFTVLAYLSWLANQPLLLIVCMAMTGMLLPLFFRNVVGKHIHWRNLYLGDTGGLVIGYVLSFVVIALSRMGGTILPDGVLMVCFGTLLIPMFDVLRVAVTRVVNHRNIFMRDNNHIHHRLMQGGMQPMGVLLTLLAVCLFFIGLNFVGVWLGWNLSLLMVADVLCWLLMQVVISYYKNKNREF